MSFITQLQHLKLAVTKVEKKALLKQWAADKEVQAALQYRFNPRLNLNLTAAEIKNPVKSNQAIDSMVALNQFLSHPHVKIARQAAAQGLLSHHSNDEKNFLVSLLTKQLALGLGVKTINQTYGKVIEEFNVQLAYPYAKKIDQYTNDDVFYVTQKLDGHRNITIVEPTHHGQRITFFSRTGQIRTGMAELRTAVEAFIADNAPIFDQFPGGFVLDGEVLAVDDDHLSTVERFQKTSDILQQSEIKTGLAYHVFDLVSLPEFNQTTTTHVVYQDRRENWLNHLTGNQFINVIPVLAKINKSQILMWSDYATQHGWEGVMLNLATGVYKKKRSNQLLKVKKMHTADLPIIGFNFDGDYLQTINVRLDAHNVVAVGSGLTDALRAEITKHATDYIDTMCEVQYFEEMTDNTGRTLRFPVFKGFRYDKTAEDVNVE